MAKTVPYESDASAHDNTTAVLPETQAEIDAAPAKKRTAWWSVLSAFLIVIGLLLAPVTSVVSFAKAQLTDTEQFVATLGPLAEDEGVQDLIIDEVMTAFNTQINLSEITSSVFDSIIGLGLSDEAARALGLLEGPIAQGLESLVQSVVTDVVRSDQFAAIWTEALRVSHTQIVAILSGQQSDLLSVTDSQIGLEIGPIVDRIKTILVDQGITVVQNLPSVQYTIPLIQSDQIGTARLAYAAIDSMGSWLPWLVLVLLVAGILVARRRSVALLATTLALGVIMVLFSLGIDVGRSFFVFAMSPDLMPAAVASTIYDSLVELMRGLAQGAAVLAFTAAILAWLLGAFRSSRAVRSVIGRGSEAARRAGDELGVGTGAFGVFLYKYRIGFWILIAVIATWIVLSQRPLDPVVTIWTAVVSLLALLILQALWRTEPGPDHSTLTAEEAGDDDERDTAVLEELSKP